MTHKLCFYPVIVPPKAAFRLRFFIAGGARVPLKKAVPRSPEGGIPAAPLFFQ
jgi:hypothetical protein